MLNYIPLSAREGKLTDLLLVEMSVTEWYTPRITKAVLGNYVVVCHLPWKLSSISPFVKDL
jgi:hypothetical protein